MKCANCGKEFGEGKSCQFCGIDRFTGLGNYNGYNAPKKENPKASSNREIIKDSVHDETPHSVYDDTHCQKELFIVCYSCNEAIPSNSKYCPMCGKELYVTCPKCGFVFSAQYHFCSQCGTNCYDYLKKQATKAAKKMKRIKEKEEMFQRIREVDRIQKERKKRKEESLKKKTNNSKKL